LKYNSRYLRSLRSTLYLDTRARTRLFDPQQTEVEGRISSTFSSTSAEEKGEKWGRKRVLWCMRIASRGTRTCLMHAVFYLYVEQTYCVSRSVVKSERGISNVQKLHRVYDSNISRFKIFFTFCLLSKNF